MNVNVARMVVVALALLQHILITKVYGPTYTQALIVRIMTACMMVDGEIWQRAVWVLHQCIHAAHQLRLNTVAARIHGIYNPHST